MPVAAKVIAEPSVSPEPGPRPVVLVVDDSRMQRKILSASLNRWGYRVIEAASGAEALDVCRSTEPDFIISDWMMPGMTGLEFCRAFRRLPRVSYGYFILLTSKSEKGEVAFGLDAGADDFLTKPVNADELRARITAGERILRMERELKEKNRLVSSTLTEIQQLYDTINRDLIEARKLQQSLVPDRHRRFGASDVALLLRPSGHVGGDLVGFFPIGSDRVGLYAIDVSGHGVTSALMTARLAGLLSEAAPDRNVALLGGPDNRHGRPPDQVADCLNRLLLEEMETDTYFTLVYAEVDLGTGAVSLVQAGHPHPLILRASGAIEEIGGGGLPIGLFPEAAYETLHTRLDPGDRLLITSDGVSECSDSTGALLGDEGVTRLLSALRPLRGPAFLEALVWELGAHAGGSDFGDDVSAVLFDFRGATPG